MRVNFGVLCDNAELTLNENFYFFLSKSFHLKEQRMKHSEVEGKSFQVN